MMYGVGYNSKSKGYATQVGTVPNKVALPSYSKWRSMLSRCYNPKDKEYARYGAEGVRVCPDWHDYQNFAEWYESNYIEGCELDKDIEGAQLYSPSTCRYVTPKENCKHRREPKTVDIKLRDPDGVVHPVTNLTQFAREHGLSPSKLSLVKSGKNKTHKGWVLV